MKSNQASNWASTWQQINKVSREVLSNQHRFDDLFEGQLFVELQQLLPKNATLFVGNSMPIRDMDTFFSNNEKNIRVLGNRGANGIDGLVSTALGMSVVCERLILVIGDLSFFHDMNGLLAAKLHSLNATIVVVNNDGGGIFSFLPQAAVKQHFEQLFGTPIGLDYEHAVRMYGGTFTRANSWESFRETFTQSVSASGLNVIELPTNRETNVKMHRDVWKELFEVLTPVIHGGLGE